MSDYKKFIEWFISVIIGLGTIILIYSAIFALNKYLLNKPNKPIDQGNQNSSLDVVIPDVPDITTIKNCEKQSLRGNIALFFPDENSCQQEKYSIFRVLQILNNSNTPNVINTNSIISNSKKIIVKGEIDKLYMYINASVQDAEYAQTRKNSVFFIVDGGNYQGYLRAKKITQSELSGDSPGVFLSKDIPKIFIEDLKKPIPVANRANLGYVDINFSEKFVPGEHLIYSYVSKPIFGIINNLSIAYSCKTENCSIILK